MRALPICLLALMLSGCSMLSTDESPNDFGKNH